MRPFLIDLRDLRNIALYVLGSVIVPLAWTVLALAIWKNDYTEYILYVSAGLALTGLGVVYWFFDRIPPGPGEAEMKEQLARRLEAGEILATEKPEPLSGEDIRQVSRMNTILVGVLIVTFSAFAGISYFPAKELAGDPYTILIPAALGTLFAFLIYKYAQLLRRILAKGEKSVVQGIITARRKRVDTNTKNYYLVIGTRELRVGKRDYRTHYVGETVRIDFLPDFGGMVLRIVRLGPAPGTVDNN